MKVSENFFCGFMVYIFSVLEICLPFKLRLMTSVKSLGFIIIVSMSLVIPALFTKISTGPTFRKKQRDKYVGPKCLK